MGDAAKPSPERLPTPDLFPIPSAQRESYSLFLASSVMSHAHAYRVSAGTSLDCRGIGFSSSPFPLSARLRPVNEKWCPADDLSSCLLSALLLLSPNREKIPRLFAGAGFGSSFKPTSSKPSSGTRSVLSLGRPCCIDERGVARERRTSRERRVSTDLLASSDWRGYVSAVMSVMGDRAEMSCSCERGIQGRMG